MLVSGMILHGTYGVVTIIESAGAWQADYGGAFIAETTEMVTENDKYRGGDIIMNRYLKHFLITFYGRCFCTCQCEGI